MKYDNRCALLFDHPLYLSEKNIHTVNFLNIRTPKKFVVVTLKFELCGSYHRGMHPNDADGMANSVDPDQTAPLGVCTVCPDLSVRKLRIITVSYIHITCI